MGSTQQKEQDEHRNEVALVGRVSSEATELVLPSGDALVTWRLVVAREPVAGRARSGAQPESDKPRRPATSDTIDCQAWTARTRRTALSLAAGDVVEVQGALRRRFYRAGGATASRCEVEARAVRRVRKAPTD